MLVMDIKTKQIKDRHEFIIKNLSEGVSLRQTAVQLGLTYVSLWKWCKRHNIVIPERKADFDKSLAVSMYESGMTLAKISEKFGFCPKTIWKYIKDEADMRRKGPKRSDVDNDYFSNIDCEEKAYWLGFLMADGCVHKNVLGLTLKDREHVLKLKKALCFKGKLHFYKKKKHYGLRIRSDSIVSDLVKHGCVPNKTYKKIRVPNLDKSLNVHFWRGYFDGDGSLAVTASGGLQLRICSYHKEILLDFISWTGLSVPEKSLFHTQRVWVVQLYSGSYDVLRRFYEDSVVYLDRKKKIYENYVRGQFRGSKKVDFDVVESGLSEDVKRFVMRHHYSNTFPAVTHTVFLAKHKGVVLGAITLGYGLYPKHTIEKLFSDITVKDYWEIGRMCFLNELPRGFGSQFLSRVRKEIIKKYPEKKVLYTWADGVMGRPGYVYQSAGFLYGGYIWTRRYLDEDLKVIHPSSTKSMCKEQGGGNWLKEDFMDEKGLKMIQGKQFRYFCSLTGSEKNCLKLSKVVWSKEYPKHSDLKWKVLSEGKWVFVSNPIM